jgi:hypothetical protein
MKLRQLIKNTIKADHVGHRVYSEGDEVYNTDTLETGRVEEVIYPTIFSKDKNIKYRINWTRQTKFGFPALVSDIVLASDNIVIR